MDEPSESQMSTSSGLRMRIDLKNSLAERFEKEGHTDILTPLEKAFFQDKFKLMCPGKTMGEAQALEWLKLISRGRAAYDFDTMQQYASERIQTYGNAGVMTLHGFLNFYRDLKANLQFKFDQEMQNMRTYEGHANQQFSIGDEVMVYQKETNLWKEGRVVNRIKNTYNVKIGAANKLYNRRELLDPREFDNKPDNAVVEDEFTRPLKSISERSASDRWAPEESRPMVTTRYRKMV